MAAKAKTSTRTKAKTKKKRKKKHAGGRPRKVWLKDFEAVGPPPADELDIVGWGLKVLAVAVDKIRTDPNMNERDRVRELRSTLRNMKDLVPLARIRKAEKLIREDADRKHQHTEPEAEELTDVPETGQSGAPLATTHRRIRERKR